MYEFIELGGKQYPIRFGMNAIRLFCKETNTTLSQFDNITNDMSLDHACILVLCGLQDGARKAGQPCELVVEDIADFLDEDFNTLTKAMEILTESFNTKERGNLEGGKKKAPKKKKQLLKA